MVAKPKHRWTPEEYLTMERASMERHEYIDGEIFDMVGGSGKHSQIKVNTVRHIAEQLRKRDCIMYNSDMLVHISPAKLYTYPDISVVCGNVVFEDADEDVLLNPILIIEVLSPSTESYDRGKKFRDYQTLDTLQSYLLISQHKPLVEHFTRQPNNQWLYSAAEGLEATLELRAIECTLSLAEVYEKVTFGGNTSSSQERS